MKLKKLIFNLMLFILCFAGSLGCVLYAGYANAKSEEAQITKQIQSEDDNSLVSLIQNITTAESISGDLNLSSLSGKTKINGDINLVNDSEGIKVKATLNGKFENVAINLTAHYITDTLYLNYKNLYLSFNVDDVITALSGILNGSTSGELSSVLNLETLQESLTDMERKELSSGGQKITIKVPNVGDLSIITNANDVPIFISATNIKLNNDCYEISINLNSKSSKFTLDTTIYTFIDVNNYSDVVSSIVKIITEGGATFKGSLSANILDEPVDIEFTINDKLEFLISAKIYNTNISALYKNGKVYLDILDNYLCISLEDCFKLFSHYFGANKSDFTITLLDNQNIQLNTGIGSFCLGFEINESNLDKIYLNGKDFTLDLENTGSIKTINQSTLNASTITYSSLITTIDRCKNIISAKEFSFEIEGRINNILVSGNAYVKLGKTQLALEGFSFVGKLNNESIALYYTDNYYYLSLNGAKVKISSDSISDLYNYFSNATSINYIDLDSIIEFLGDTVTKLQISSNSKLSMIYDGCELTVLLRGTETRITAKNVSTCDNNISIDAKVYANSTLYKSYLSSLCKNEYTDFSDASSTIKAVVNTIKQTNSTYSGYFTLGIATFDVCKIGITLNTYYTDGKIKLVAELTNLPTATAVTNYNSLTYKGHKATVTLFNGKLTINRTIKQRFTGKTITALNKTINFKDIDINILKDIFGLSNYTINLINKASSSNATSKLNLSNLVKGLTIADDSLKVLTDSFGLMGITDFHTKITHKKMLVSSLNIDFSIKDIVFVHLKLNKK